MQFGSLGACGGRSFQVLNADPMNAVRDITGALCWAVQIVMSVRRHVKINEYFVTVTPLKHPLEEVK